MMISVNSRARTPEVQDVDQVVEADLFVERDIARAVSASRRRRAWSSPADDVQQIIDVGQAIAGDVGWAR
jgi:hypothetical protein